MAYNSFPIKFILFSCDGRGTNLKNLWSQPETLKKKKSLFEMFRFYLLSTITFRFYTFIQQQWLRSTNLVFCVHSKRSVPLMNRAIKRSLGASVRGQFDMLKFHYNLGRVSCFWPTQIKKCEKETKQKKVNCQLGWFVIHKQIESNLGCNQP